MSKNSVVSSVYIVSGQPHILLGADQSPGWSSLRDSYERMRLEIEKQDADIILYLSTQWMSVIGYMFQGDPAPKWTHVDHNFHDLGSMSYDFRVDTEFAEAYASEVSSLGYTTKVVNYRGFPIDTGTIVAQKLLNPQNKLPAAMVSCGLYAEKEETTKIGQAATWALNRLGKKAIVVLVSNLSNRFEIKKINPKEDKISSLKDNEWNEKILEIFSRGGLEDVSQIAREFGIQANADLGFKGVWWLNGLCGETNNFKGKVFDYQPVWGTGAAAIELLPTEPIVPMPWSKFQSEEGSQAEIVKELTNRKPSALTDEDITAEQTLSQATLNPPDDSRASPSKDPYKQLPKSGGQPYREGAIHSRRSPEPVGAYPHARKYGNLLFLSGMGPRERGTKSIPGVTLDSNGLILDYDIKIQTRSVLSNLKAVLEDSGSCLEKILDIQVFLTNIKNDFADFNLIYKEVLGGIGPTRTTVEVRSLPTPIAVELKVIAEP